MIKTSILLHSIDGGDPFRCRGADAARKIARIAPAAVGYVQSRSQDVDAEFSGVAELWFPAAESALEIPSLLHQLADLWREDQVTVAAVISGVERVVIRLPSYHHSVMIKGVFPFRRKPDLSVADFQHHWWHNHGPIAALTQDALCYTQSHVLAESYVDQPPRYDGITELYWSSRERADAAMQSEQMREDQANDADNFVDRESIALFFTDIETVI